MFHEVALVTLSHPVWLLGGDPAACWSKNHFIRMSKGWQILELDGAGAIRRHTADKTGTGTDGWWDRDSLISYFRTKYTESIAANQPPASHTWLGAWNASSYAASIAALPHPHSFGPIFLLCDRIIRVRPPLSVGRSKRNYLRKIMIENLVAFYLASRQLHAFL